MWDSSNQAGVQAVMKIEIGSIRISERVRKDVGDIAPLMASMQRHGQLNPVTVTRGSELVAGYRRLSAARKLGWQYIDANVVERDSEIEKLELELEENVHRKDFSPEELLAGYRRLDTLKHPSVARRIGSFFRNLFARLFRRRKSAPAVPVPPPSEPPASPGERGEGPAPERPAERAAGTGVPVVDDAQPGEYGV